MVEMADSNVDVVRCDAALWYRCEVVWLAEECNMGDSSADVKRLCSSTLTNSAAHWLHGLSIAFDGPLNLFAYDMNL